METIIEQLRALPQRIKQRDPGLQLQDDKHLTGFARAGRKNQKDLRETWRHFDLSAFLDDNLQLARRNEDYLNYNLCCNVPQLEALRLSLVNGHYYRPLQQLPNGVVVGGLRDAMMQCAELIDSAFGTAILRENPYQKLNNEHFSDGLFVYVPDGVVMEQPIQLQSIANNSTPLLLQTRNLVIVGRNSHATFIHCDDSATPNKSVSNNVTELVLGENSHTQYYKLQNLNNDSALLNQCYTIMQRGATLLSNAITLNGGLIRNHSEIRMLGEDCSTEAHGLYLVDKEQQVDNYIYVEHNKPHCTSRETFKGILDDQARGTFSGHVLVCDGAKKTEAYMNNKNILMTDKALINTHPFLEIYNDDVKCSHGATTGQVNDSEMFYLRSRGITERTARTLLLYAFCDEVVQKVQLPTLKESIADMVKKRLHGELTPCSECSIPCSSPCNGPDVNFRIDLSKL